MIYQLRKDWRNWTSGDEQSPWAKPVIYGCLAVIALCLVVLGWTGSGLHNLVAPGGIVSFELARDADTARSILASWGRDGKWQAMWNLLADIPFAAAYGTLLALLCSWSMQQLSRRAREAEHVRRAAAERQSTVEETAAALPGALIGYVIIIGQLVAAACDILEDICLLIQVWCGAGPLWAWAAYVFALTKFTLVGMGVVYILFGFSQTEAHQIVRAIRFSLFASIAGPLLLLLEQAQEALRVMLQSGAAGMVWFVVSVFCFGVMSWWWGRLILDRQLSGWGEEPGLDGWCWRNLPRLCAALPLFLAALALAFATRPVPVPGSKPALSAASHAAQPPVREVMSVGSLLTPALLIGALVALGLLLWATLALRRASIKKRSGARRPSGRFTRMEKWLAAATFLPGLLLLLALTLIGPLWPVDWGVGTPAVLFAGLGLIIPVGGALTLGAEITRVPFLSLLLGAAALFAAFDVNDNHRVRDLARETPTASAPLRLAAVRGDFARWLAARPDRDQYRGRSYPVFLVAAEGGGLPTAFQTAHSLSALQDADPNFVHHVYAISGVSGGSLGAATFAALAAHQAHAGRIPSWQAATKRVLGYDALTPTLAYMLSPDLVQRFLPFSCPRFDRARALEMAFEQAWRRGVGCREFQTSFYELRSGDPAASVPALLLNSTHVAGGERMTISHLEFSPSAAAPPQAAAAAGKGADDPVDDATAETMLPQTLHAAAPRVNPRLSTAVGLSARFPLVTPSGYIPMERTVTTNRAGDGDADFIVLQKERYVDGGYFENSGISTLTDLLHALGNDFNQPRRWHPVVLHVGWGRDLPRRAAPGLTRAAYPVPRRPQRGAGFDEVWAPIGTLVETRDGRAATALRRLEDDLTIMRRTSHLPIARIPLSYRHQQGEVAIPLGWLLSDDALTALANQVYEPTSAKRLQPEYRRVLSLLQSNAPDRRPAEMDTTARPTSSTP